MKVLVADEDTAMSVLCGLLESFEHLEVSIGAVTDEKNFSLDFVKSRLLPRKTKPKWENRMRVEVRQLQRSFDGE